MSRRFHSSLSACLVLTSCYVSLAQAQITGKDVMEGMSVSPAELSKLESGTVLTFSDEAYENSKRELSADAMILVNSDLDTVYQAIVEEPTLVPGNLVIDQSAIDSEADFAGVEYTEADYDEVKELLSAKPGKDLNFSDAEYALLQQKLGPHRRSSPADQIAAASEAMREILIGRYKAYQGGGLGGIEAYSRSRKKKIDISRELRFSTETFKPFEGDFPEFYKVMHDYPAGADCCTHYFRWLKVKIRKRPTFALSHTMVQRTDDFILATERYYFATSTLNSLQVTLSWLKYDDDTYMGLAMAASTDLLDSMMGRILRPIGRNKAKDMVSDIMHKVQADLEGGAVWKAL